MTQYFYLLLAGAVTFCAGARAETGHATFNCDNTVQKIIISYESGWFGRAVDEKTGETVLSEGLAMMPRPQGVVFFTRGSVTDPKFWILINTGMPNHDGSLD